MKDSVIFYKSFYEIIKELPDKSQLELYNAIFKKYFYGEETQLKGISKGIFGLIVPNIDSANKRYFANVENGKKGGRPKKQIETKQKPNNNPIETQQKPKQNLNDKDNDNVNDKDNTTTNIYTYIENNFGITISGTNYEKIESWLSLYDEKMLCYAVDTCVANGTRTIRYLEGILKNWKGNGYKNLADVIENEEKYKSKQNNIPEWFDKEQQEQTATSEDIKELEDLLKSYKED